MNKVCSRCKTSKTLERFGLRKESKDGYYGVCRDCRTKSSYAWKRRNRDKVSVHNHTYYEKNTQYFLDRMRHYREERPWWDSWNKATRKANERGVETIPYDEFRDTLLSLPQECLACGRDEDLTVDHIVPWSVGGDNTADNIQILCKSCNSSKWTQIIDYRTSVEIFREAG